MLPVHAPWGPAHGLATSPPRHVVAMTAIAQYAAAGAGKFRRTISVAASSTAFAIAGF